MDIDVQNFDAGFIGFADDNDFSNLAMISDEARAKIISQRPSFVKKPSGKVVLGVGLGEIMKRRRANLNQRQNMWINAFRQRNKEIERLNEKLKVALVQGDKSQKKALENQLQSLLLQVKQLEAQNEDLLRKNSVDAVPKEVVVEEKIVSKTPDVQPDRVPPNIDESAPVPPQVDSTKVEDIVEAPSNKNKWIVPALVIGVVAFFIFRNK